MKIKTHYDNLKVERDASPDEIKRAFRKLIFQHHPDRHPPENKSLQERRIRIIKEAYDVLSNPSTRAAHDKWIKHEEEKTQGWREKNFNQEQAKEDARKYEEYRKTIRIMELETSLGEWQKIANDNLHKVVTLTKNIDTITKHYSKLKKQQQNTQIKSDRKTMAIISLVFILIGFSAYHYTATSTIETNVASIISERAYTRTDLPDSPWKINDWSKDSVVLFKEGKTYPREYLQIVNRGNVNTKLVERRLKGSFVDTPECDAEHFARNKSFRFRFIQLETNTVLSVVVPLPHLCSK